MDNNIPLGELYRVGSEMYYKTFRDARQLHNEGKIELTDLDLALITETDIGEFATYKGEHVPLDSPMMEAEYKGKEVELPNFTFMLKIQKQEMLKKSSGVILQD